MKKIFVLMLAVVFALGVATMGFATEATKAEPAKAAPAKTETKAAKKETVKVEGTVTKVAGTKITFKDASGKETTVKSKKKVAVGDTVIVENGKIVKVVKAAPEKK